MPPFFDMSRLSNMFVLLSFYATAWVLVYEIFCCLLLVFFWLFLVNMMESQDLFDFDGDDNSHLVEPSQKRKKKDTRNRRVNVDLTGESIQKLIQSIEQCECLWNVSSREYKNRDAKEASWNKVAEEVQGTKQDALVKWNSLRVTYRVRNVKNVYLYDRY